MTQSFNTPVSSSGVIVVRMSEDCLEAWHINSAHVPLNRDDGGLSQEAYLHLVKNRRCHHQSLGINMVLSSRDNHL